MLGWALKKGIQGATGKHDAPSVGDDTTQVEVPDTPAPVFAARAIKNAIWGSSHAPEPATPAPPRRIQSASNAVEQTKDDQKSPNKPTSILLTPGTGTARRKRVSFGHDVKAGSNTALNPLALHPAGTGRQRRQTTLQQALENSRSIKDKATTEKTEDTQAKDQVTTSLDDDDSDGDWEDEICNHDMTLDLNEPHSESGKYWKSEFDRYRDEARSDIERLVKYKALAKSFAAKKDAEANGLNQKLREEQVKVTQMEDKIADMAAQIAEKKKRGIDKNSVALSKELAKQTSLAVQYRDQVKDLETLLKGDHGMAGSSNISRKHINTSPRTEQTLLEVGRELRKARSDLKHTDKLRDQVKQLKSGLALAQDHVKQLEDGHISGKASESSEVQKLKAQLRELKEESRQKDSDIRKLKKDYESLKEDAKARTAEALQVLHEKNDKISQLEETVKRLASASIPIHGPTGVDAAIAEHNRITRDLKSNIESLSKPSRYGSFDRNRVLRRSVSAEDITLDMAQRSLPGRRNQQALEEVPKESLLGHQPHDWTASLLDIEDEWRQDKKDRLEAQKCEKELILREWDAPVPQATIKSEASLPPASSRRVMSVANASRTNRAKPSDALQSLRKETSASDHYQENSNRLPLEEIPALTTRSDKSIAHRAGKLAIRERPRQSSQCPISSGREPTGVDLVRDHFARLGGPETDRDSSANTSRCALPADRQAAARARLQQKKLERQKTTGRSTEKENVAPQISSICG